MKQLSLLLVIALFVNSSTFSQPSPVYSTAVGAIDGYDPVAFFTAGKPVKGNDKFVFSWNNADWHFSSRQNLDSFSNNPQKYAPQYGGYCAFGCSEGHKAPTQPDTWSIIDDKLYLNYNKKVKEMWLKDIPERINQADKKWETVKDQK